LRQVCASDGKSLRRGFGAALGLDLADSIDHGVKR
jgi:hypothetical protein